MSTINPIAWFRQKYFSDQRRFAAITSYKSIDPLCLADIAQRGFVSTSAQGANEHETLINVGRQQLALEIVALAGADPLKLFAMMDRKSDEEKRHAA